MRPHLLPITRKKRVARACLLCKKPIMITQKTLSPQAWAELLLLSLIWGASFLAFAIGLEELPVFTLVAHRIGWGAVAMWIYVLYTGVPIPRGAKIWAAAFAMGLFNNVIPFSLIAWGQTQIESGLASILNATTAFFGLMIAAMIFADERVTWKKAIGTLLGFVGVVIIIGPGNLLQFDPRSMAQFAILGAAVSYGIAGAWGRKTLQSIPPQSAALGMLTGATVMIVPLAFLVDGNQGLSLEISTLTAVIYLAIFATFFAYLLYYRVLAMAGSANLMLVTLLVVPIAVILGILILGEQLTPMILVGTGLIGLGMLVIDGRLFRRRG